MALFSEEPKFDFIGKRWYAVAVSMVIISIGVVAIVIRGGLPLGIDFSGYAWVFGLFFLSTSPTKLE